MKLTKKQIYAAAQVLKECVTSKDVKLRWGALQRQILKDRLERGDKTGGYRVEWIKKTRLEVVDVLQKSAKNFNETYKHDHISAQDLLDVLNSTINSFQVVTKRLKANSQDAS